MTVAELQSFISENAQFTQYRKNSAGLILPKPIYVDGVHDLIGHVLQHIVDLPAPCVGVAVTGIPKTAFCV